MMERALFHHFPMFFITTVYTINFPTYPSILPHPPRKLSLLPPLTLVLRLIALCKMNEGAILPEWPPQLYLGVYYSILNKLYIKTCKKCGNCELFRFLLKKYSHNKKVKNTYSGDLNSYRTSSVFKWF